MQYVHYLRNIRKQPKYRIYRQIIRVDIEVEYLCDIIIYHYPTSVYIFLLIHAQNHRRSQDF